MKFEVKFEAGDKIVVRQENGKQLTIYVNYTGIAVGTTSSKSMVATYADQGLQILSAVDIPEDSERFKSRGIGSDRVDCFVCGKEGFPNISGFVQSKEAGERIVKMFQRGARLDFRPSEPEWIQVKVGACRQHAIHLKLLDRMVKDGWISEERIKYATQTEH